ncbi:hypothetical protein [Limimaricola litoreus]|uniref:Uncharacterized protein n=1 Tax=Limimaricola litoreus TaxID=2955316 RepID=A0A9X2FML4_9RHOB|nr:hypothetical protein [Limimaricola litoreus]MCP1167336.1 hypothetical protein [Limimaricola litoreus]
MKITEIRLIDEVFLEAHIDADDMQEGLIVDAERIHPNMPLHLSGARWGKSGKDAIQFLTSNFAEIRALVANASESLRLPARQATS